MTKHFQQCRGHSISAVLGDRPLRKLPFVTTYLDWAALLVSQLRVFLMVMRPKAYVAALPLSSLPELQELLSRFCGGKDPRENVVMVRLGNTALGALDQLVEGGLFGSRSEAAAFLLGAGIEAQRELFKRVGKHSAEIKRIRQALKEDALDALRGPTTKLRRSYSPPKNRRIENR